MHSGPLQSIHSSLNIRRRHQVILLSLILLLLRAPHGAGPAFPSYTTA